MKYKCLTESFFTKENYSLTPYREKDIFLIKNWRNEQMDVLRQNKPLSDSDQKIYYTNYILPTLDQKEPKQILFSYLLKEECIGYGGLTNIDWTSKRCELSYLVNPERTKNEELYEKEFSNFISLIKEVVFSDLNFNRIFTETFEFRRFHVSVIEKNDFKFEGRMKEHVLMHGTYVDSLIHGFIKKYYDF